MIALFIDESGSFECDDKVTYSQGNANNEIVGGVLCFNIDNEKSLQILNNKVKNDFIDIGGNDYFNKIHGKTRNGVIQNTVLQKVFCENKGYDRLIPFYIQRGKITKNINSNITDDNTAAMLYYNMVNRLVSNIILYYPDFIKDNKVEEVQIYIASRTSPLKSLNQRKIEEFKKLGHTLEDTQGYGFKLNGSDSILININDELNTVDYMENRINISISKVTIEYNESLNKYNEIFQLSDFVCNNAYLNVISLPNKVTFLYDDINDSYRRIYRNYKNNNLYEYLEEKYKYEHLFKGNSSKKNYDSYLNKLDKSTINTINNIKECISKLGLVIHNNNYERRKAKFFIDYLDQIIEQITPRLYSLKLEYYYIKLSLYNHFGDFSSSKEIYKKVMESADTIFSLESIMLKLKINNLFAVTCSNEFNFREALQVVDDLIEIQKDIEKIFLQSNYLLFNKHADNDHIVDLEMGKLYSSKGQYLAFLRQEGAYENFHEAIKYMGEDLSNRAQTVSYLIHYLADSTKKFSSEDNRLIKEYMVYDNFYDLCKYFINLNEEKIVSPPEVFKLFAFLKLYVNRKTDDLNEELLMNLSNKLLKLKIKDLEHPWQLIFYTLGKYLSKGKSLKSELFLTAIKICNIDENDVTIKMMSYLFMLEYETSNNSINKFVNYLKCESVTDFIREYFELAKLEDVNISVQDKKDLISSKFTFMYC